VFKIEPYNSLIFWIERYPLTSNIYFNIAQKNIMIKVKNEVYLTTLEAAEYVGRARQTVYQLHKKWGWPAYNYGPRLLFKKTDLEVWLENQIQSGRPQNGFRVTETIS